MHRLTVLKYIMSLLSEEKSVSLMELENEISYKGNKWKRDRKLSEVIQSTIWPIDVVRNLP